MAGSRNIPKHTTKTIMLKRVLAISGKPGLFELISQATNALIVEDVETGKRMPAYANDKVISLADIAIYTEGEEVPLTQVFENIKKKENGNKVEINLKDNDLLRKYFGEALPNFDQDRVYNNDIRKVIRWYNILTAAGRTDFVEEAPKEEPKKAETQKAEEKPAAKKTTAKKAASEKAEEAEEAPKKKRAPRKKKADDTGK